MSGIETAEAPEWLSKLESRREKLSKAKLGHDSGAGAACNSCGPECPGLDLHFWRKICRACRCSKDSHDVRDDDLPGWAHFELLGGTKPKRSGAAVVKLSGKDEPVRLDWVPPNVSSDMISDYMSCLGDELAPVSGSEGAAKRREQLRRQIPLHDIRTDLCCYTMSPQEQKKHQEYISQIKNHIVGMGNIVRVGVIKKGDVLYVNVEESQAVGGTKSYSLPLKASSVSGRIRYANVPKNTTDKLLVLDKMGNVINKSAHYADFKTSPILSAVVKEKLNAMKIESDRIKSAVEHGPVYDKLFEDLGRLNVPVDKDVYLMPIKKFRKEYHASPKFRDETTMFAESQGANVIPPVSKCFNNNGELILDNSPSLNYPQKGTIFGPDGEIWSWNTTNNMDPNNPDFKEDGNYGYEPKEIIPLPNFSTHPNNIQSNNQPKLNYPSMGIDSFENLQLIPDNLSMPSYENAVGTLGDNFGNLSVQTSAILDSNHSIPCHRCKDAIKSGEIAVTAERAGDAYWHPKCFTCVKCNELLVDNMYFYHRGDVYCQRDLAEALKITRCAACDELIFSRSYTMAEGHTFHADHFCCIQCDVPLANKQYVQDDKTGQPICLVCYERFCAAKCHYCKNVIAAHEQAVSWQSCHWHGVCFICSNTECAKSLLQGKFVVKNEMPFCSAICVRMVIK